MNKIDHLKAHLKSGRSITALEAIGLYSMFRLGARIYDLKKAGWNIVTDIKYDLRGTAYAEYRLEETDVNPHGLPEFALPKGVK